MNAANAPLSMGESVNLDRRLHAAMQPGERGAFSEVHPTDKETELRNSDCDIPGSADLEEGGGQT